MPKFISGLSLPVLCAAPLLALAACGGQAPANHAAAIGDPQPLYDTAHTDIYANVTPLELAPGGSLGALGLNLEPLFAQQLSSPEDRLSRLEATVLAIQSDLQTLAPSMQRMAIVEQDLAAAVTELREILQQQNTAKTAHTPATKTTPKPSAQKTALPKEAARTITTKADGVTGAILPDAGGIAAPATQGKPAIRALRIGEHGAKTRLVFDATAKSAYRTDLDNNEKLLIVEMDDVSWGGKIPAALSSPMVQSYAVQPLDQNGGTRIIIQLKKPAKISHEEVLRPEGGNTAHRLVLDLVSAP